MSDLQIPDRSICSRERKDDTEAKVKQKFQNEEKHEYRGGVLFIKSILRDLLGEVACSSLPENLGRFSLILRARPPGDGSLRRNLRDGGAFANPFTTRGFA